MDFKQREQQTGHAVCSPSQLYRILACPASIQESLNAPISPPSSYAQHGTMLHDVMADYLTKNPAYKPKFAALPIEDQNAIEDALDYVRDIFKSADVDSAKMAVEGKVDLKQWDIDYVYGTLDLSIYIPEEALHVIDWKFGSGVSVAAEWNEQLLTYAAGSMAKYGIVWSKTTIPVFIHVVQPFINNYDVWEITSLGVSGWVVDNLEPGLRHAMSPEGKKEFHPGEKQCRWCPAAMTCRARLAGAQKVAKDIFKIHSQVSTATKAELADILVRAKDVAKYASQIEKYAMAELSAGREFPGFKLIRGKANRTWIDPDRAWAWLNGNSSIPEDKLYSKKIISAAQAEKLDRLLKKDKQFQDLYHKPEGKIKMAPEDSKAEAITPSTEAAAKFAAWKETE